MRLEKVPEGTEVFTLDEFSQLIRNKIVSPEDGTGRFCVDKNTMVLYSDVFVRVVPPWASHVAWFNK